MIEIKLTDYEARILNDDILEYFRIQHQNGAGHNIMAIMDVLMAIQSELETQIER